MAYEFQQEDQGYQFDSVQDIEQPWSPSIMHNAISRVLVGQPIDQAWLEAEQLGDEGSRKDIILRNTQAKLDSIRQFREREIRLGEEVTDTQGIVEYEIERARQPHAAELSFVDQVSDSDLLDPEQEEEYIPEERRDVAATRLYLARKLQDLGREWNDKTTFNKTRQIGRQILPLMSQMRESVIATTFDEYEMGIVNWFNNPDNWEKFVASFWNLSDEDRSVILPHLEQSIEAAASMYGAETKTLAETLLLAQVLNPDNRELRLNHLLEVVDLGGVAATMGKALKVHKTPVILSRLGRNKAGAKATVTAAIDEKAAQALNMTRSEALEQALPFSEPNLLPAEFKANALQDFKLVDEFLGGDPNLQKLPVEAADIDRAAKRIAKDAKVRGNISNIHLDEKNQVVFNTTRNGQEVTIRSGLTLDDFESALIDPVVLTGEKRSKFLQAKNLIRGWGGNISSAKAALGSNLVDPFTDILSEQGKLFEKYKSAFRSSIKGLNDKSTQKVYDALLFGDEDSKIYTYQDAVINGLRDGSVHLSPEEYRSYLRIRHIMTSLKVRMDKIERTKRVFNGEKVITDNEGNLSYVKPFDYKQAVGAYDRGDIIDTKTGKIYKNLQEAADLLKNEQRKLVRSTDSSEAYFNNNGKFYKWRLVSNERIQELPEQIYQANPGYVPRSAEGMNYFVKVQKRGVVEGLADPQVVSVKTSRQFQLRHEAEQWRQKLIDQGAREDDVSIKHIAEMTPDDQARFGIGKGLYRGGRAEEMPRTGLSDEGITPDRVPVQEAIYGFMSTVSHQAPLIEWRLVLTQKWMNQAKQAGLLEGYQGSFLGARRLIEEAEKVHPTLKSFLLRSHDQIRFQIGIPTDAERRLERTWTSVVEILFDGAKFPGADWATRRLHKLDHKNWVGAAKAATFHNFLGVLNPRQLIVQAMNSAIVMSLYPTRAPRAIQRALHMGWTDLLHNPNHLNLANGTMRSRLKDPNLDEAVKLWQKSGIRETVISGSGDYAAIVNGAPTGPSALLDKGLVPYRAGELFSQRAAFSIAYDVLKERKAGRALTEADIPMLRRMTDNYTLNMKKSNLSYFQKNEFALASQFLTPSRGFIEALMVSQGRGGFSRWEKFKLILGQSILFGTAGIPFMDYLVDSALGVIYSDPSEIPPGWVVQNREGLLNLAVQSMGLDVDVAEGGALGEDISDKFIELAIKDQNLPAMLLGPSGTAIERAWNGVTKFWNFLRSPADVPPQMWAAALSELGRTTSTWNNLSKSFQAFNNDLFYDKNGNPRLVNDTNTATKVALGFGFQLNEASQLYKADLTNREINQITTDFSDSIVGFYRRAFGDDQQDAEMLSIAASSMLRGQPPEIVDATLDKVYNKLTQDPASFRIVDQFIRNVEAGLSPAKQKAIPVLHEQITQ